MNERLRAAYGDAWYDSPSVQLNDAHIQQVQEAKDYLRRARKKVDAPGIISKLSLGFWVGLFSSRYETPLWHNHLRWIFTRAPKSLLRDTVYRRLERMRRLRNRVAHHEPILHLPLTDEYCSILNTIEWLCLATALYTARQSHFPSVFENRPQPTCHSHLTAESQSADP